MSSLCLTAGALSAALFAQALHLEWTAADGARREESWHVAGTRLELVAARIAPPEAVAKPPEGAVLAAGKLHHWPRRAETRLVLRRAGLASDYVLCGEGWCTPLERLLPRASAPVVEISACPRAR